MVHHRAWPLGLASVVFVALALALAGCGGTSSAPGVSTAAAPASPGHSEIHRPPANWQGHPPFHVNRAQTALPTGYSPAQIRHAYGFDQLSGDGTGQTIALVEAYGSRTIQRDLDKFCSTFNIPSTTVTIAYPGAKPKARNAGWALETALDVEWAHAIAPGANILVVVARSALMDDLLLAIDYASAHASQVSMSWGGSEWDGEWSFEQRFNKPGVSFTASTGDEGTGAQWPAVSAFVTAVGGTTLNLDSTGNILAETAWSGSNGGPSGWLGKPDWQIPWQTSNYRSVPDVSLVGDPSTGVAVYTNTRYEGASGWFQLGGTSAGAPMWAALLALARSSGVTLSTTNPALYGIVSPTDYAGKYFDIIAGANLSGPAVVGYDMVTGIGTPNAPAVISALGTYSPAVTMASAK